MKFVWGCYFDSLRNYCIWVLWLMMIDNENLCIKMGVYGYIKEVVLNILSIENINNNLVENNIEW